MRSPDRSLELRLLDLMVDEDLSPESAADAIVDEDVSIGDYGGCSSDLEIAWETYVATARMVLDEVGGRDLL